MALNFKRFIGGIQLVGTSSTAVSIGGEMEFLTSSNKLNMHNGTTASPIVTEAHTATLTNKTLSGNTASSLINGSGTINFNSSGTITVPNATDTLVGKATTDTLTNKTLSGNTASSLVNGSGTINFNSTGTITVPNATDTLVGKATTDTLTNKSIDAATNTLTNIANSAISATAAIAYSKLNLSNSIVNADVATGAAIAYSKLNLSGSVTNADLAGSIAASKLVGSDIATVGTITTGTWSATTIALNKGGTGQTTATAAFDALAPSTTKGDIIVRTSTSNTRQSIGSDGQVLVSDSTQTNGLKWTTLQQGAKNYITYNNFENNATTGWSLSHTTLSSLVPNQASGSWTSASGSLAFTTVSSGALAGTYSGQLAWTGTTSVAGDMLVSDAYTIDKEDQAKVMTFKFYYSVTAGATLLNFSGTSSNTYQIYIYDVANSAWIQPAGVYGMTQNSGVGYVTGTFQTPSNMTSFRIAIVCVNASSSGSHTILFDDFTCGPQTAPYGPAVTDWVSFTPTGSWVSNTTYTGQWRRIGDTMEIQYRLALSGAPTSTSLTVNMPSGYSIDTTKLPDSTNQIEILGFASLADAAGGNGTQLGRAVYNSATSFSLGYYDDTSSAVAVAGAVTQAAPFTWASGDSVTIVVSVPVVGWSSNVQMSNDTDTRVVAARYQITSGTTVSSLAGGGADTLLDFNNKVYDTHAAVTTGASWKFIAPISGYYRVSSVFYLIGLVDQKSTTIRLYKNGVTNVTLGRAYTSGTSDPMASGSTIVQLNAGDYITIYGANGDTVSRNIDTTAASNDVSIERLSGPAVVAATEKIAAHYTLASNQTCSSGNQINFATKLTDTHSAVTTGVNAWKFSAPVSGVYQWSFSGIMNTTSSGSLRIYKNAALFAYVGNTTSGNAQGSGGLIELNAGDYIDVRPDNSIAVLDSSSGNCHFSVFLVK
jgi:hypothetical protein